jgi:hypothetical protein
MLWRLFFALTFSLPACLAQPPTCMDARGLPVTIHEAPIPDLAHALFDKAGKPGIVLNATFMKTLPPSAAKFILYHEFGHQALGHLLGAGSPLTDEPAADCWAVRSLVLTGQFDGEDIRTAGASVSRLNHTVLNAEPATEPWRAANLKACIAGLPTAAQQSGQDELASFFQWPMISSQAAGTHFFLRTRFRDGRLQYVATVTDSKGRSAKYFVKSRDRGAAPPNFLKIAFTNGSGSYLYTLTIPDSAFLKIADTGYFEAIGESSCTEELYRASLQGSRETAASSVSSHSWIVPSELR